MVEAKSLVKEKAGVRADAWITAMTCVRAQSWVRSNLVRVMAVVRAKAWFRRLGVVPLL